MSIQNVPDIYLQNSVDKPDVFVYDFRMTSDVVKSKTDLSMHMFSFLQVGRKQVHFSDTSVAVNKSQSLLLKKGNCLWTELLDQEEIYNCKLLFFSDNQLTEFLKSQPTNNNATSYKNPYFIIENDEYLSSFITSISTIIDKKSNFSKRILEVKFEEIMLYLIDKYGINFINFLHSLTTDKSSKFQKVIKNSVYSNLKLEEIAFLCNMSLSTFKRRFTEEFNETPGKWIKNKRLQKAKEILEDGNSKPSDIYLDFGYNNLSNFSSAFKSKFGFSPNKLTK